MHGYATFVIMRGFGWWAPAAAALGAWSISGWRGELHLGGHEDRRLPIVAALVILAVGLLRAGSHGLAPQRMAGVGRG
jgi:hypothetical protein